MSKPAKFAYAAFLAVFAAAVLFASPLSLPTTFNAGDTLSAAAMNGNFSAVQTAVDDNDTRITTNTGDIAANATAIAGKVSLAGDTMTGGLTVPSLTYSAPRAASVTYITGDFLPSSSALNFAVSSNGFTYVDPPSTSGTFYRSLGLPAGVTVTGLEFRLYDAVNPGYTQVCLYRGQWPTGSQLVGCAGTTDATLGGTQTASNLTLSHLVQPGPVNYYSLELYLSQANLGLGGYGVTVHYEYTQP